jgi:hypothetical protein
MQSTGSSTRSNFLTASVRYATKLTVSLEIHNLLQICQIDVLNFRRFSISAGWEEGMRYATNLTVNLEIHIFVVELQLTPSISYYARLLA